ncbi:MAG: hypothetical protein AMXMBFR84_00990 [Candidatus Hydrogenedentota bacterium]
MNGVAYPLTDGPPRVQIQTQAGCNGRCVFCPNEELLATDMPHGKMSWELFTKIIDELATMPPRRIGLYMMNEPLSDKRMPEFVRYVSEKIPSTKSQIITNGTALNETMAEALIDAGLKELKCSLQSLDPETNKQIMGYESTKVIENCINFKKALKRKRSKLEFRVSMVVQKSNVDDIPKIRKFWDRHRVRLVTSALENRGGNIKAASEMNIGEMKSMGNCIRPSRDLMILYNGDVPLCCVDWFRTTILGNVERQSIREVWHGDAVQRIRDGLREGDVTKLPDICRNCGESAVPHMHRRGLKGILSRLAAAF